jgi:hypothetical protein
LKDLPKIQAALPVFIAIELINLIALYTGQIAVKLGVPVLVSAVEASTPAYAFGISLLISIWKQKGERDTNRNVMIKLGLVSLTILGVWSIGTTRSS